MRAICATVLLLTISCYAANAGKVPFRSAKDNLVEINIKEASFSFPYNGFVVDEKIRANPNDFVITYEVTTPEGTAIVVDDYRSYVRAVRPHGADRCVLTFISPNKTDESGEEFAERQTNRNRTMAEEEITIYYGQQGPPLKNTNILCQEARDVCKGIPVYWGGIEISKPGETKVARPKRAAPHTCRVVV